MQKGPVTPKGFRDILPKLAQKRRYYINTICDVLEKYNFVPLETPTLEFADTLLGKYGEDEKLIYTFKDRGGRNLALRYDLTVPLARFVANNLGLLNPSFSRYQIGQVFRGENPQKGRYREFTQVDFDCIGIKSLEEDAKVIAATLEIAKNLKLRNACMSINDRENFKNIDTDIIRAIDKIHKFGKEKVKQDLAIKGIPQEKISFLDKIESTKINDNLKNLFSVLESKYDLKENENFLFDPTLARGLDYYTGAIFELKPSKNQADLSLGGGGRYDNLIGIFAGREIPAVGFSFGLDRLIDLLD